MIYNFITTCVFVNSLSYTMALFIIPFIYNDVCIPYIELTHIYKIFLCVIIVHFNTKYMIEFDAINIIDVIYFYNRKLYMLAYSAVYEIISIACMAIIKLPVYIYMIIKVTSSISNDNNEVIINITNISNVQCLINIFYYAIIVVIFLTPEIITLVLFIIKFSLLQISNKLCSRYKMMIVRVGYDSFSYLLNEIGL